MQTDANVFKAPIAHQIIVLQEYARPLQVLLAAIALIALIATQMCAFKICARHLAILKDQETT